MALAAAAPCGVAHAGAWVETGGRSIVTYGYASTPYGPDSEVDAYTEVPLAPDYAVVATTRNETQVTTATSETLVALKYVAFNDDGAAVAIQGGPSWTESSVDDGCERLGGEIRVLAGASTADGHVFVNGEAGARLVDGGCAHALLDGTLGWKPTRRWLALAEVFLDRDLAYGGVLKGQISIVRFFDKKRGLQLGVRAEFNQGEFASPTFLLGYWSGVR